MIQSAAILAGERIVDLAIPRVVASPQRVWPCSRQDGCSFTIVRIQLENTVVVRLLIRVTTFAGVLVWAASAWATVVSDWNAAALAEVRLSKSLRNGPPMVARALAIAHTCMYDAWAAFADVAVGTTDSSGSRRRPANERTDENKAKAISFAAYRCLRNLYPDGSLPPPLAQPSVRLNTMLLSLGYSLNETCNTDQDCRNSSPETAAGLGNIAAQAVIDAPRHDGSKQYGDLTPAPCPVAPPWPLPCAGTAYGQTSAHPTPRVDEGGGDPRYVAAGHPPPWPPDPA